MLKFLRRYNLKQSFDYRQKISSLLDTLFPNFYIIALAFFWCETSDQ